MNLIYTWKMSPPGASRLADTPTFPAAVFAVVLVAAVVATDGARATVPALQGRVQDIAQAERPLGDDHYLAGDIAGQVDHHVLYFGLDDVASRHLQTADVLFLGNSRLMFALRPEVLGPEFAALGLSYYALGFGSREADRFPLAILRKFDLRPRVVVVNADGFFIRWLSAWAEAVNRDTPFAARKLRLEAEASHRARQALHVVAPHWLSIFGRPGLGQARGFNIYRSRIDGTWEISPWPSATSTFAPPPAAGPAIGRGERAAALAFKAEMDRRGITLILTRVPTPEPHGGAGPARFAELLKVPLVLAEPPGLTSADHSHLDAPSAFDWSREFMAVLAPHLGGAGRAPVR